LQPGSVPGLGAHMYTSVSFHKILPEHLDDYIKNMNVCAEASNKEPGCVRYEVMQDEDDPHMMCLFQVFQDADAYQAHQDSAHHVTWVDISKDWRDRSVADRHLMTFITPLQHR
jgi:quinol monooxygenase YgiN